MANNLSIPTPLNEQQVLMLRLIKNPLPEKDFVEIRRLAVKLLSKKLDQVVGACEEEIRLQQKHTKN